MPVLPLLCVHGAKIPWDEIYVDNVPVLTPAKLLALLRSLEAHLDPTGGMLLAEHARHKLHPATWAEHLPRAPGFGKAPRIPPRRGRLAGRGRIAGCHTQG